MSGLVQRPARLTVWDVLAEEGALHVFFEGAENLPGGGVSKYGTSVTRE